MKVHQTKEIFLIIEDEEKKEFKIAISNNVVSAKTFKTKQAAKDYINQKPYELIINSCFVIMQNILNQQQLNSKNDEKTKS